MNSVEVFKITVYFSKGDDLQEYSLNEYIQIPTSRTVLFTTGENKITYYDKEGNELPVGKSILFIAKTKRAMMKERGESY